MVSASAPPATPSPRPPALETHQPEATWTSAWSEQVSHTKGRSEGSPGHLTGAPTYLKLQI